MDLDESDSDGFGTVDEAQFRSSLCALQAATAEQPTQTAVNRVTAVDTGERQMSRHEQDLFDYRFQQSLLTAARTVSMVAQGARFPWEVGFAAAVLGPLPWLPMGVPEFITLGPGPAPPLPEPRSVPVCQRSVLSSQPGQGAARSTGADAFMSVAKKLRVQTDWTDKLAATRVRGIRRWIMLIEDAPDCFGVCIRIMDTSGRYDSNVFEQNMLDILSNKSTGTILKRAGSLLQYVCWVRSRSSKQLVFPIQEPEAYEYVGYLKALGNGFTRAESFRSALKFAHFVLGMTASSDLLMSTRIAGASFAIMLKKPKVRQRDVLSVQMVLALESIVLGSASDVDKVGAGFFLFLLFGRARFGDAQRIEEIMLDLGRDGLGFIECKCGQAKGGTTAVKRNMFLPIVAQVWGVGQLPWGVAWIEARNRSRLSTGPGKPFLPEVCLDGTWSSDAMTSHDASRWLNELIAAGLGYPAPGNRGTHSMKGTGLSWPAKAGVRKDLRRTLGYHVASDEVSTFTYSRDSQAEPLRAFGEVVRLIRVGDFNPDDTRSGRFREGVSLSTGSSPPSQVVHADAMPSEEARTTSHVVPRLPKQLDILEAFQERTEDVDAEVVDDPMCVYCMALIDALNSKVKCSMCEMRGCKTCIPMINTIDNESICPLCVGPATTQADIESVTDSSDSSDSSDEETDSEESTSELILDARVASVTERKFRCVRSVHASLAPVQHVHLGTLHLMHKSQHEKLACGRLITDKFADFVEDNLDWPQCAVCFGRHDTHKD